MAMKEILQNKHEICLQAIYSLYNAITLLKTTDKEVREIEFLAFQDSAIKRFEYSLDVTWKYVKKFLEIKKDVIVKSPRETFNEIFKQTIISAKELSILLEMYTSKK
jgi:hypothetical protein